MFIGFGIGVGFGRVREGDRALLAKLLDFVVDGGSAAEDVFFRYGFRVVGEVPSRFGFIFVDVVGFFVAWYVKNEA